MKTKFILSLITTVIFSVFGASAITSVAPMLPFMPTATVMFATGITLNTMFSGVALSIFNPADLTWNGKEIMSLSEAILEQFYQKPAFNTFHQLESNIKAKQQIAILGSLGLMGRKYVNGVPQVSSQQISASEKFWEPAMVGEQDETIWSQLQASFFIWGLKNGLEKNDLTGTDFINFLEDRYTDAMAESAYRVAWFGDKTAENFNGSPAGYITNGVDLDYFDMIDGFWKQLFAIGTTTPARHTTNLSAKNAQANYALQEFNATDTTNMLVTTALRDLIQGADMRLRNKADKIILCTLSIADQYENELESQGIDASFVYIQTGVKMLERKGVKIYAFDFFDRTIDAYQNDGTAWHLPHRMVMYQPVNLRVGLENESNLTEFESFYDKRDMKQISRFGWSMDAKVIEDYAVQVAY